MVQKTWKIEWGKVKDLDFLTIGFFNITTPKLNNIYIYKYRCTWKGIQCISSPTSENFEWIYTYIQSFQELGNWRTGCTPIYTQYIYIFKEVLAPKPLIKDSIHVDSYNHWYNFRHISRVESYMILYCSYIDSFGEQNLLGIWSFLSLVHWWELIIFIFVVSISYENNDLLFGWRPINRRGRDKKQGFFMHLFS